MEQNAGAPLVKLRRTPTWTSSKHLPARLGHVICRIYIYVYYVYYVYDDDDDEITKLNRQTICKLELIFHNSMAMSVY